MPISVNSLLGKENIKATGCVKWGEEIPSTEPGIYIVSTSSSEYSTGHMYDAPISNEIVAKWISSVNSIRIDMKYPSTEELTERLSHFWLPDESILYIGKAGRSIRKRVRQYYRTELGQCRPHAGGHWVKTLSILNDLFIYWVDIAEPEEMELQLLNSFKAQVSAGTLESLYDPNLPLPFANRQLKNGQVKRHGITGSVIC